MRSVIIVEVFPGLQLWRLGFDVDMPHALVFNMSVKPRLKLMTSVRSDGADPEGKLLDHVVRELDRTSVDSETLIPC